MYYGNEKVYEMTRSILPSKSRKLAKFKKRQLNKKIRREAKQALQNIHSIEDWYEEELDFDFHYDGQKERSEIVCDRRLADKVGPFIRWAEEKAKHIPDGEKLDYIRSLMPGQGSLITEHALDHLRFRDGFNKNPYRSFYRRRKKDEVSKEDLKEILSNICNRRKYLIALNDAIRKYTVPAIQYKMKSKEVQVDPFNGKAYVVYRWHEYPKPIKIRILEGHHDIESFIEDIKHHESVNRYIDAPKDYYADYRWGVTENPEYNPSWGIALRSFVEHYIDGPDNLERLKDFNIPRRSYGYNRAKFYYRWSW